jgi:hypothetical protein
VPVLGPIHGLLLFFDGQGTFGRNDSVVDPNLACASRLSSLNRARVLFRYPDRLDDTRLGHFLLHLGLYRMIERFLVIFMWHA